jgi:hypothetical protein
MPAHINYETTEIIFYRFVCDDPNIINTYVGHTTNFIRRKSRHKQCCNSQKDKSYHCRVYQIIRDNGGWDNWNMIEIHRQLCIDDVDARKKEQEYIEYYNCNMNSRNAYTSRIDCIKKQAEYDRKKYETNKDEIKLKKKEYDERNREIINAKAREYHEKNKDKVNAYSKEYKKKNKDKVNAYSKEYHEKNKDKLNAKRKQYRLDNYEKVIAQEKESRLRKKLLKVNIVG